MKYLVFFSMLVLSCATTNPADTSGSTDGDAEQSTRSLVAGKSWTLKLRSGCVVTGFDDVAKDAECPKLGKMELEEELSKRYGAKVATLKMKGDNPSFGGPFPKLSHSGATYNIDARQTGGFAMVVEYHLYEHKIAEREKGLQGAEPCAEGDVVVRYDSCPGFGDDTLACGNPITTCGAPLKMGEACRFNASCESGRCTLSNYCGTVDVLPSRDFCVRDVVDDKTQTTSVRVYGCAGV